MRRENSLPFPWIAFEYNEKRRKSRHAHWTRVCKGLKIRILNFSENTCTKNSSPFTNVFLHRNNSQYIYRVHNMLHVSSNKLGDYILEWKIFFENETKWVQIYHILSNMNLRIKNRIIDKKKFLKQNSRNLAYIW